MSASYRAGYEAGVAKRGHISGASIVASGFDLRDFVLGYRAGWNSLS